MKHFTTEAQRHKEKENKPRFGVLNLSDLGELSGYNFYHGGTEAQRHKEKR